MDDVIASPDVQEQARTGIGVIVNRLFFRLNMTFIDK